MTRKLLFKNFSFLLFLLLPFLFSAQKDCATAMAACGNMNITYTPNGPGNYDSVSNGCLSGENNSAWYKFTIATSGTLTFMITPLGNVDYDWAVYGPNVTCANRGAPIRCNYAGPSGNYLTGLNMTNTNTSSTAWGSPYCKYMDVIAGETYYLFIDNYSPTVYTFNLTWGGTATLQDPFNNPALSPNPFNTPGVAAANPNSPNEIYICSSPISYNFSTLTPGILNGNQNYVVTYHSSANNALTGTSPLPSPTNVTAGTTYYYSINYQDPSNPNNPINSCRKIGSFIFINKTPNLIITPSSTTLCPNGTVTLTSNQTSGNTWSTGATTQSITVNAAGNYTLSNNNGYCTGTANITINAQTDPNLQISGNLSICPGTSTALTATANGSGNTYSWNTGATTSTINVSTAGTYTVTVKTSTGCTFTKTVIVNLAPAPTAQNSTLTVCSTSSTAIFDLTSAQTQISTSPGATFTFYQNLTDAQAQNTNNITTANAYSSGNTTLYVLVKVGNCSTIAQLQLIISPKPTPTITASAQNICGNSSVTLTSSLPTGNTWSTGETTQTISVNTAGTYTLTNSNGGCTSSVVSTTITQTPDPNLQISGNLSFCQNFSTNLTATATGTGHTYSWSNGATTPTINVSSAGNYTVTLTTATGCIFTKSVTVSQLPAPIVQNATLNICSSSTAATFDLTTAQTQISTTSGATFTFYQTFADAQAQNTSNITTITAYNSPSTTLYVLVKVGQCSAISELQLIVNVRPIPIITASAAALCDNSNVVLTSNFPTGNTWSTGATTQSITVTTAGTYTVTVNDGTCTSLPVSYNVVANPNPNIQISGNLIFCEGNSTTLTASATGTGNTFSWSNGSNTAVTSITTPGTHTVTVTTPGGCQYQKSVNVVMDPKIIISIAPPQTITCTTPQITIDASASTYLPGSTFAWTASGGGNIVSGATTLTPVVNNGGLYTLTIKSPTPMGCTLQNSINVLADKTNPVLAITAPSIKICQGESVVLTAHGAATYTWNNNLPGNGNTQTVSPTTTTTYTITGVGTNGCSSANPASLTITVVPTITSTLTDIEFCKGETGILNAGSNPGYTYLWSNGATTSSINVTNAGVYSVTIKNGTCSKTFTATVKYTSVPTIQEVKFDSNTLTIIAAYTGNVPLEYSIDGGLTWQLSNVFPNVLRNTLYTIRVKTRSSNCYSEINYYTTFIPNTISPNFDGKNDKIDFTKIIGFEKFEGTIFNKYGTVIFRPSSKTPVWDGTYLGNPLPTDTYWYRLSWIDNITKKPVESTGWIVVKNRD